MIPLSRSRPKKRSASRLAVLEWHEALIRALGFTRRDLGESPLHVGHEVFERDVVEIDAPPAPELLLDRVRARENGPRAIADRLVSEDAVQEDTKAPLDDRIRDEEQMAAAELRSERHGHDVREVALRQIPDVVVLADDEALAVAFGARIDSAVHLEDHRPLGQRELRVGVRDGDDRLGAVGRPVEELSSVRAERDERDDVDLFSALLERALESAP